MKDTFIISALLASALCQAQTQISAVDALNLASQNRPSLKASRLGVERARLSARALSAPPAVNLAIGASSRSGVGADDQDLALTQEIDPFGRRRALLRIGEADVQIALATYRREASLLQSEVLMAFVAAVSANRQSKVATELLEVAHSLLEATKRRFDEGKIAELQVTRATIEFERAKQTKELKDADSKATLTRLAALLAVPPGGLSVDPEASIEQAVNPLILERPDVLELKAEASKALAEAGFAKVTSRPDFSLQVVRSPWSNDRGYFVGRAQLSWNLWDHGKSRNEARAANLRAEAATKALADATARAEQELAAVQIELDSHQARITSYEAILVSARDLVAKSQKGFSEGFGTQVDVLEATRALREVEQELVVARQLLALTVIRQYEAAGYLFEALR